MKTFLDIPQTIRLLNQSGKKQVDLSPCSPLWVFVNELKQRSTCYIVESFQCLYFLHSSLESVQPHHFPLIIVTSQSNLRYNTNKLYPENCFQHDVYSVFYISIMHTSGRCGQERTVIRKAGRINCFVHDIEGTFEQLGKESSYLMPVH